MEIKLHANATTTPRIRRYLQQSNKSDRELAKELGISVTTVRRWRNREQIADRQTTPHAVHKALRSDQVSFINLLREQLHAPLDELLFLVVEGMGISVSRATLNRYLKSVRPVQASAPPQGKKALKLGLKPTLLLLHYALLPLHMDDGGEHHLLWAQEPISGWLYARVYSGISPTLVASWLADVLARCPADIQSVETDGSSWLANIPDSPLMHDAQPRTRQHYLVMHSSERWGDVAIPPLAGIFPVMKNAAIDEVVQRVCELWNTGKGQKKLGESTPQHFLEALWQKD